MFYWGVLGLMISSLAFSVLLVGYFLFFNKDFFFLAIGVLLLFLAILTYLEAENLKYDSLRRKFKERDSSFPKENKLISSILLLDELSGRIGFKRKYAWIYKEQEVFIVISFKKYLICCGSDILYKKSFSRTSIFKSGPWITEFNTYVKSLNVNKMEIPKNDIKKNIVYEEINF